jgi:ribonucleoside-diphosphate reductase alpha chain
MQIDSAYMKEGDDPFDGIEFRTVTADDGREYIVPAAWSAVSVSVLIEKIFHKGPVPERLRRVEEPGLPESLFRSEIFGNNAGESFENDMRVLICRVAGGLAYRAARADIFDGAEDADRFYRELCHILLHQIATLEPALWQMGLDWAYGMSPAEILPADRLSALPEGFDQRDIAGIAIGAEDSRGDILKRVRLLAEIQALHNPEARLSVTLPVENVDSINFISSVSRAESDEAAREVGRRLMQQAADIVMQACDRDSVFGFDPAYNPRLKAAMGQARALGAPEGLLQQVLSYARQGFETFDVAGSPENESAAGFFDTRLSVPDDFIETALTGHGFMMIDAGKASYHAAAPDLLAKISESLWSSGNPKVFFRDTANKFLNDAAPGSAGGLVFTPGVSAPSAVINLSRFVSGRTVDQQKLAHVVMILAIALEASFGNLKADEKTATYRPMSIGFCGLAPVFMSAGIAYDSAEGRATAAALSAFISGAAYLASAQIADRIGACDGYAAISRAYLQDVQEKIAGFGGVHGGKGVMRRPQNSDMNVCFDVALPKAAQGLWEKALHIGRTQGFRHGHLTALATSLETQALLGAPLRDLMSEQSLVHFAENDADLYGKRLNPAVVAGLKHLGYTTAQIDDIHSYVVGQGTLLDAPGISHDDLRERGFSDGMLQRLDAATRNARHIRYVFNEWILGEDIENLESLGFSEDDIDDANIHACGTLTLEGAPHLKPEHLAVFDCAQPSGPDSVRRISAEAQMKMQGAVESFLSGAAAHTIFLEHHTGIDDIQKLLVRGWELGVKTLHLYRDASSLTHGVAVTVVQEEGARNHDAPLKKHVTG